MIKHMQMHGRLGCAHDDAFPGIIWTTPVVGGGISREERCHPGFGLSSY